jgi:hypothetical protein
MFNYRDECKKEFFTIHLDSMVKWEVYCWAVFGRRAVKSRYAPPKMIATGQKISV